MQVVIPKSASAVIPSKRDYINMHQDKHDENETTMKALEATPHSLLDCLSHYSDTSPSKDVISYLNTSGNQPPSISSSWSFSQLDAATNYLAFRLLDTSKNRLSPVNLTPGDRVILVYPPCSPHFLISFLACLRAGLIAVPTYPPHPSRKESLSSFTGIVTSCDAKVALTNGDFATFKRLNEVKDAFRNKFRKSWPEQLKWVVTDNEPLKNPPSHDNISQQPSLDSIAFLQYTSGSTSEPKGVSITHANLAHNLAIITKELQASPSTVVVSWLPQYHDMGLIGSLLGILYCGGRGYYMSPVAFLARPMAWIEAVSKYRGSHLQAPNFAFGLTARKFDPREYFYRESGDKTKRMLDLTCLKHIINGAEPVTQTSIGSSKCDCSVNYVCKSTTLIQSYTLF
jgi:acyl-CoA synthetase (AMP-forming)/AMP-acid ligase II